MKADSHIKPYKKYEKGFIFILLFILITLMVFIYSFMSTHNKVIYNIQEEGISYRGFYCQNRKYGRALYTFLWK